jgi:ABC-type nitrate/sulfonate/bicarbonate transport system permease component
MEATGAGRGVGASRRRPSAQTIAGLAAVLTLAIGWEIASHIAPTYAIPGWGRIVDALVNIPVKDVAITILRLVASMVVSFFLGLAVSSLLFERPIAEAYWMPFVRLLMAVPAVCWVVFAILWFKNVELRIFFVMCVVCAPVFIVDSLDAMKAVPADLRQMVGSFRPNPIQVYTKVIYPGIVPNLITSWKINLTLAVRVVTIAELVGAVTGVGHGLVMAQEMFSVAQVFAWTAVLVIILFSLQFIITLIEKRALRWRTL